MAQIDFTVVHQFNASAETLWNEMLDWPSHGEWIPATRVEVDGADAHSVGATFTGYTGYGPLTLVDRMRISEIQWNGESQSGSCTVEKLGPVLRGEAGFTVTSIDSGSQVEWFERVTVPYLPRLLAPIVNRLSAAGFGFGMRRLAKVIAKKQKG